MTNNEQKLVQLIKVVPTRSIPISKIVYDENNPNKMSDSQMQALDDVVTKYGFAVEPWLNEQKDGTYMVIDGEHRVRMLQNKGIKKVHAKIFKIKYSDVRILRQVANKLRGRHDSTKDAFEIKAIFEDGNLDKFAQMLAQPLDDFHKILEKKFDMEFEKPEEEQIPEPPAKPKSKPGEIYKLGCHKIMCGDCTNKQHMEKLCDSQCAILFTSPPYNLGKNAKVTNPEKDSKYNQYNDDNPEYLKLLTDFTGIALSLSDLVFVNIQQLSGNKIQFIDYLHHFKNHFVDVIIWDKQSSAPALAKNVLNSEFEYILIFSKTKKPSRSITTGNPFHGTIQNIYHAPLNSHNEYADIHRAVFPIHLPSFVVKNFSKKQAKILDPFLGTGTTLIACEQTDRACYGMELDPRYVDVIIQRWENYTGKKAELIQ